MPAEEGEPAVHRLPLGCIFPVSDSAAIELIRLICGKGAEKEMLTGKVVRFDDMRGYGFIAPDKGGEDVFMHANSLVDDKLLFIPGLPVEFEVTEGDRGLKAYAVQVRRDLAEPVRPVPKPAPISPAAIAAAPIRKEEDDRADGEEELCDVLTIPVFRQELIDLLLESVPTLTAAQIGQILQSLIKFGTRHGWVEN